MRQSLPNMEPFDYSFFVTVLHLVGVAIGLGGAFFSDMLFFRSVKNGVLSLPEVRLLHTGGTFVTFGLLILIFSGVALFFQDPARYMDSSKFLAKMVVVAVISFNGAVFHAVHLQTLRRLVGVKLRDSRIFAKASTGLFISGAISVASWLSALALGALRSLPYSLAEILYAYAVILFVASVGALVMRRSFLKG